MAPRLASKLGVGDGAALRVFREEMDSRTGADCDEVLGLLKGVDGDEELMRGEVV